MNVKIRRRTPICMTVIRILFLGDVVGIAVFRKHPGVAHGGARVFLYPRLEVVVDAHYLAVLEVVRAAVRVYEVRVVAVAVRQRYVHGVYGEVPVARVVLEGSGSLEGIEVDQLALG